MATPMAGIQDRSRTASEAADTVESLKADIAKLADTVGTLAREQMGTVMEGAQEKASEKLGDIEAAIRKNPTQAATIAAGVGFLIGLVLIR